MSHQIDGFIESHASFSIDVATEAPENDSTVSVVPVNLSHFKLSKDSIPCIPIEEQDDALKNLDVCAYNQDQFENEVMVQVNRAFQKHVEQQQLYENHNLNPVSEELRDTKGHQFDMVASCTVTPEDGNKDEKLNSKDKGTSEEIYSCDLRDGQEESFSSHDQMDLETDQLIRTGEMTPFGTVVSGIRSSCLTSSRSSKSDAAPKYAKKVKLGSKYATGISVRRATNPKLNENFNSDLEMSDFGNESDENHTSDEDYIPEHVPLEDSDFEEDTEIVKSSKQKRPKKQIQSAIKCKLKKSPNKKTNRKIVDDGLLEAYSKRMKAYRKSKLLAQHKKILESTNGVVDSDDDDERNVIELDGDFKIPYSIWNRLYSYQQTGVKWLWELHQQNCGGIVGDEMGLGKTIQVIVFLVGLKTSGNTTVGDIYEGLGPVLLVCPATIMHQWVNEFHTWWPLLRVAILHESGSYFGKKEHLVNTINQKNGILITSYNGLVQHQTSLLPLDWHYLILDEGHKIRNPDAQATLVAKQFRTCHRLILSGSPVQNNLKELWSLFDFVFPGKLGTLPIFMQQFSVPIVQGGYANASQVQVQTAYKCATVLQNTIKPYLLRRMKADVQMSINLPNKNEQVLFCKLSDDQLALYKAYIDSSEVQSILNARLKVFIGLINLRKICNHPDLYSGGPKIFSDTDVASLPSDMHYGYYKRSGKMIVVESLLRLWYKQSHRVLLFTQSRQMLQILEIFVQKQGYTYMKMDGSVSISSRQPAIAKFNSDPSIFVFLLTTRVGGLGVNLTGANRIIIYDPDWNPSTDTQARERSWRIGQDKDVTIYRLLTAGTIEEKIYHRQIFKQFVTNRVLKDPRQRRFFKSNDLYELFSYSETGKQGTETSAIFAGTGSEIKPVTQKKNDSDISKSVTETDIKSSFSTEQIERMKELAKKLSSKLTGNNEPVKTVSVVSTNSSTSSSRKKSTSNDLRKSLKSKHTSVAKVVKRKKAKLSVDGEKIDFLVKKALYKASLNQEQSNESANDNYVLSKLFKTSSVHTALRHDVIVDSSDPDYMLVEGEANRVAQEAIKALKRSRRGCARASQGIPTWTGSNGQIQFGEKKRNPHLAFNAKSISIASTSGSTPPKDNLSHQENVAHSSSADILQAIRERTKRFGPTTNHDSSDEAEIEERTTSTCDKYDDLLTNIRNFIAFGASDIGRASTEELLDKFKDKLPIEDTAIFKSLLNKICDFSRTTAGNGIWTLKQEFL